MPDILYKKTTYVGTDELRYLYKPVSEKGAERFTDLVQASDHPGWYGFGDWGPDNIHLGFSAYKLVVEEEKP